MRNSRLLICRVGVLLVIASFQLSCSNGPGKIALMPASHVSTDQPKDLSRGSSIDVNVTVGATTINGTFINRKIGVKFEGDDPDIEIHPLQRDVTLDSNEEAEIILSIKASQTSRIGKHKIKIMLKIMEGYGECGSYEFKVTD